jgi:NAD(P)-dependent dehydrogenase (short-subunit alcohol dehydrogenase family)
MELTEGQTAVVTGAASGIGLALARELVGSGLQVVLADVEEGPLRAAVAELGAGGAAVLGVPTDVSDGAQVDALARQVVDAFGPVHLLCNNAGVGGGGLIAELSEADWAWVLGVNLWGVIHGLRSFLPGMLAHGQPAHVVNTASVLGLITAPFTGPYAASKFAVEAITETLFHELAMTGSPVGVSVLCPGWVRTRIAESDRNRPAGMAPRSGPLRDGLAEVVANGMPPELVARAVLEAVRERRFYVLTHPEITANVEARLRGIVSGANPELHVAGLFDMPGAPGS